MAIEISSDTVVKILVRRGTDSERQLTTLTEGELGYCVDTQRLFIGDGITTGGIVAGNKFLGLAGDKLGYNSISQVGDYVYQTTDNTLYSYSPGTIPGDPWLDIHPRPYVGSLEKGPLGKWRLAKEFSGDDSFPNSGFTILYSDTNPNTFRSITKQYNRLDFDARYISLCAYGDEPSYDCSFYLGNINQKTVANNLSATLNVKNSLFLNTHQGAPRQVRLYAENPLKPSFSTIESISGGFDIRADESLNFSVQKKDALSIRKSSGSGNTFNIVFSSAPNTGSMSNPNFDFTGKTLFRDDVYFDAAADVTIMGNLSVLGETTYLDTIVTVTSALSVINKNLDTPAFFVGQFQTSDANNQTIGLFTDDLKYLPGSIRRPVLQVKERQFLAINAPETYNLDSGFPNYSIVAFGDAVFKTHPNVSPNGIGVGNFGVDVTNILDLSGAQGVRIESSSQSIAIKSAVENTIKSASNTISATNNYIIGDTTLTGFFKATGSSHSLTTTSNGSVSILCNGSGDFTVSSSDLDIDGSGNIDSNGYFHSQNVTDANGTDNVGSIATMGGGFIKKNLYVGLDVIAFTSSDKRLKNNIKPIDNALEKLEKISGVLFDWNEKSGYTGRDYGVIAQEVEAIMPEIVVTRDNGYKAVKYEKIIPLLIEAIKELGKNK